MPTGSVTLHVLLVQWLLIAVILLCTIVIELPLPVELTEYVAREVAKPLTPFDMIWGSFAIVILLSTLVSSVGLWLHRRWARAVYALSIAGSVVVAAFGGPVVEHPVLLMFSDVSLVVAGAIIALTYYGPIDDFRHTAA